jgi:hypothetical protein
MRSRALRLAVAVLVVAAALTVGVAPTWAIPLCHHPQGTSNCYSYGAQATSTRTAGIDGLIIPAPSTLGSDGIHVANWIGISNDPVDFSEWVQAGAYQGTLGNSSIHISSSTIHADAEWQDACGDYYVKDLGAPPSPYGYYVWTTGNTTTGNGCGTQYIYYVRVGSWSSPIQAYGYVSSKAFFAEAMTEMEYSDPNSWPTIGTSYFGCTASHQCNASAGLHLYSSGWYSWTSSNGGMDITDGFPQSDAPPTWHNVNSWYSFYTTGN